MSEKKPSLIIVNCSDFNAVLPMLKALDISTAEVVVVIDDAEKTKGLNVNILATTFRVKDIVAAITQYI